MFHRRTRLAANRAGWTLGTVIFLLGIPSALGEQFLGIMDALLTIIFCPSAPC